MYKIFIAAVLTVVSFNAFAQADFTLKQEKEIQSIVEKYIGENPEIVLKALENLQLKSITERKEALRKVVEDNREQLFNNPNSPIIGNKKAKTAIVEFFDYNCGYCRKMFEIIYRKMGKDKDIKLILKELPSLGEESLEVSKIALAMNNQGKYRDFHITAMRKKGAITKNVALDIARELKADMEKLEKDKGSKEIMNILQSNRELADKMNTEAVPTFVIGTEVIQGAFGEKELEEYIRKARKK